MNDIEKIKIATEELMKSGEGASYYAALGGSLIFEAAIMLVENGIDTASVLQLMDATHDFSKASLRLYAEALEKTEVIQ